MRSTFSRLLARFGTEANPTDPLLSNNGSQPFAGSELNEVVVNPPEKPVTEPSLYEEILACLEILESAIQHHHSRNQMRTLQYVGQTGMFASIVLLALAAPASMIPIIIEASKEYTRNLMAYYQKALANSIKTEKSLQKQWAFNEKVIAEAAPYKPQADRAKTGMERKLSECEKEWFEIEIIKYINTCSEWIDSRWRHHKSSEFGVDIKHPFKDACSYEAREVKHPLAKCDKLLMDACNATRVYESEASDYLNITRKMIPGVGEAINWEHYLQSEIKENMDRGYFVEPISTTILVFLSLAALAALIYYIRSFCNVTREYRKDKKAIQSDDKITSHIKQPELRKRFSDLAAHLNIPLEGTTLSQGQSWLKEYAKYQLIKEQQRAFFQSPFFRKMIYDVRYELATEYILSPEKPKFRF
jgi:hypothetical protein